jgi:hypothetical protein
MQGGYELGFDRRGFLSNVQNPEPRGVDPEGLCFSGMPLYPQKTSAGGNRQSTVDSQR